MEGNECNVDVSICKISIHMGFCMCRKAPFLGYFRVLEVLGVIGIWSMRNIITFKSQDGVKKSIARLNRFLVWKFSLLKNSRIISPEE